MEEFKKNCGGVQDAEDVAKEPGRFANLTYDSGFKIVFGTQGKSEELLMAMLNRLLGLKIVSLRYLPNERLGQTEKDSESFFDVYCEDATGRSFLIEMQMWSQHYFHKRAVYYSSLSVQDQARAERKYQKEILGRRHWNYYFAPVYVVCFLNFPNSMVDSKEGGFNRYISHYVYRSLDTGRELGDETNLVFIDLDKFRKGFSECCDLCEQWLYSIRNMHLLRERPEGVDGTELEALYNEAYFAGWSADRRAMYERQIMNRNDYENILAERFEDGFAAGVDKGRGEGREEGREEGRVEIIKRLLGGGLSCAEVAKLLSLSESEVQELIS